MPPASVEQSEAGEREFICEHREELNEPMYRTNLEEGKRRRERMEDVGAEAYQTAQRERERLTELATGQLGDAES